MSDKPRMKLTDEISVDVVDPHDLTPVFADLVTELRMVGDVLHLSLANLIVEGSDPVARKAHVCARLRISGDTVRFIQGILATPEKDATRSGQVIN